jgi:hypothetical protein
MERNREYHGSGGANVDCTAEAQERPSPGLPATLSHLMGEGTTRGGAKARRSQPQPNQRNHGFQV